MALTENSENKIDTQSGKKEYLYIIESRKYLSESLLNLISKSCYVLSLDFFVINKLQKLGIECEYLDKYFTADEGQKNNQIICDFLRNWNLDEGGRDLFSWKGVDFGSALKVFIWSDIVGYVRLRLALQKIRITSFQKIFVCSENSMLTRALIDSGLEYTDKTEVFDKCNSKEIPTYFFDISSYMQDSLFRVSARELIRIVIGKISTSINNNIDKVIVRRKPVVRIYAQTYHPTIPVIKKLSSFRDIKIVTSQFFPFEGLQKVFKQRIWRNTRDWKKYNIQSSRALNYFNENRSSRLVLSGNLDITDEIYELIEDCIAQHIPEALSSLDSILENLETNKIDLGLMVSNIGLFQTLVGCVLKRRNIPTYMIINGLLTSDNCDEAKDASVINSYSESIKKFYFKNQKNVIYLGDPRMDAYSAMPLYKRSLSFKKPTIIIGCSGYNNIDLNSNLAVEFDFLFQVIEAIKISFLKPDDYKIVLKLRPNNFIAQYNNFIQEYFTGIEIEIIQYVDMIDVLRRADLYISTYSQTLFEAASIGIPVIYFKNHREFLHPLFDLKSELPSAVDKATLAALLLEYTNGSCTLHRFCERGLLEKYVGPIDGKNTERNVAQIFKMLQLQF